jgi:multiple sugar transport system ATP-binding protein
VTTIYVTHDQVEAMTLGDRVAVLRDGLLQQFDVPQRLYDEPVNLFVAEFIGSPAMNLVGIDLVRENGSITAQFAESENRLRIGDEVLAARPALTKFEGKRIILGVRPEDLDDASLASDAPEGRRISAVVDIREDMGSEVFVHFSVGGKAVRGEDVAAAVGEETLEATMEQARKKGSLWVGRLDRESPAREGDRVELVVSTKRLHFFDPETGRGIYADES